MSWKWQAGPLITFVIYISCASFIELEGEGFWLLYGMEMECAQAESTRKKGWVICWHTSSDSSGSAYIRAQRLQLGHCCPLVVEVRRCGEVKPDKVSKTAEMRRCKGTNCVRYIRVYILFFFFISGSNTTEVKETQTASKHHQASNKTPGPRYIQLAM